jgi:uncharacterized protein YndB with AHSA1/START domain
MTTTMTETDRIEKQVTLNAPRSRVWRAIADSTQFGEWFGVKIEGPFAAGKTVRGKILNKAYEHIQMEMTIEQIEPERYFAYRWHPYANDPKADYSSEPTTLVEFRLEEENRARSSPSSSPASIAFRRRGAQSVPDGRARLDGADQEHRTVCHADVAPPH